MGKSALPPPPESAVLKDVMQYLALAGILAWRTNSGGMRVGKRYVRFSGARGLSDVCGVLPEGHRPLGFGMTVRTHEAGRALFVEVKRKGGRLRPAQAAFLANVRAAGALGLVCASVDSLRDQLREAGYECP